MSKDTHNVARKGERFGAKDRFTVVCVCVCVCMCVYVCVCFV